MMSNLIIVRSGDIYVIFNHDNDMFNIQDLSDSIGCKSVLSSIVKDPLNGIVYPSYIELDFIIEINVSTEYIYMFKKNISE